MKWGEERGRGVEEEERDEGRGGRKENKGREREMENKKRMKDMGMIMVREIKRTTRVKSSQK
jgi:hypothetical protein